MPELPDVAVYKKYMDATSLHKTIQRTSVSDDRILEGISLQKLSRELKGHEFEKTVQHGKYLMAEISGKNGWLVLHFGMTGELNFYEKAAEEPKYARCIFDFADNGRLAVISRRLLGRVMLTDALEKFLREKDLGPHALDKDIDVDRFAELLSNRGGMIKTTLMNQSIIAGIGNVYADEILYQAGIHPETKVKDLETKMLEKLFGAMRKVTETAIDHDANPQKMPPNFLLPHRRAGASCPGCKGKVEKIKVGGRGTYVCPDCQKK